MKDVTTWYSERLDRDMTVARWGHYGTPLLLFPTAGGDAQEVERNGLIGALWEPIEAGRLKVYSCDSAAGQTWLSGQHSWDYCCAFQNRFDSFIYEELVPAIHTDCGTPGLEIMLAGASIGAFNAVASLCRHPDIFTSAIAMSGTYDLERLLGFQATQEFYFSSPLLYLPNLDGGQQLDTLRRRFVVLAFGQGDAEDPEESRRMGQALGAKGIPNRVDAWGPEYPHDWPTWRDMLPRYLEELRV
jgi:esterase/lipase superfamily enzyme